MTEARRSLAVAVRCRRHRTGATQVVLARALGSSQSRVAKMEAADATVSLDLLVRAMVVLGATRVEVGRAVGWGASEPPEAGRRRRHGGNRA